MSSLSACTVFFVRFTRDANESGAGWNRGPDRIRGWYPDLTPQVIPPTGAGRSVNHQLALLAERLAVPDLIAKTLELLPRLHTQEDRMHALFVLRNCRDGVDSGIAANGIRDTRRTRPHDDGW